MEVNHILLFSGEQGNEADELVEIGLKEGSNRVHPGQGTQNRKFYFKNFFLEIVWVIDEKQARSELTSSTGIWERSSFREKGFSPFGICFTNTEDLDGIFAESINYKPVYIPKGTSFEIIPHQEQPFLPWICRLPAIEIKISGEPTDHLSGLCNLTGIRIGISQSNFRNELTRFLESTTFFHFYVSEKHHMTLEFDHRSKGRTINLNRLPLSIEY
jgi:hypothetical protein